MSSRTNYIQSNNLSAVYERLYGVYTNVGQLDAPIQLNQLPEPLRNQIYGQVYQLANRPLTNDSEWGRNNAFRDLHRLQAAIRQVAFNNYLAMPVEQRNVVSGRVYEYSGRPQTTDPQWGENHANDRVDILFRSLIGGTASTIWLQSPPQSNSSITTTHDGLLIRTYQGSGSGPSSSRNNGTPFEPSTRGHGGVRIFSLEASEERVGNLGGMVLGGGAVLVTNNTPLQSRPTNLSHSFSSRNNVTPSSSNHQASSGSVTSNALRARMARMGLSDRLDAVDNQPTFVITPVSAGSASLSSEDLISRKSASLARIDQINNMGDHRINRFDLAASISTFNLDALLENYEENHDPHRLLELVSWADIGVDKRCRLTGAIRHYSHGHSQQERLVQTLFSKLFSYFDQKRSQSDLSQEDLNKFKVQCRSVVDKIIDAHNNCVDQMLSQLQEMLLDIVVDAYVPTEGDRSLGKILCRAGQELCLYKTNLIKQICVRQNPNENHMADLERLLMQRLADILGLRGAIFNSGAQYGHLLDDVDNKINRAVDTFWQEYRPLEYLSNQLSIVDTSMSKLRNELLEWADNHYGIAAEDADHPQATDMNPHLSAHFDPDAFKDFLNGGVWSAAGTLFLMETAGLIRQV